MAYCKLCCKPCISILWLYHGTSDINIYLGIYLGTTDCTVQDPHTTSVVIGDDMTKEPRVLLNHAVNQESGTNIIDIWGQVFFREWGG